MSNDALVISGLSSGYGDITVLRGIDLTIDSGATLAVVGRNGAGKTALLRGVMGLNPVSRGSVHLAGRDVTKLPTARRVGLGLGFVQEGKRVFRQRSVEENLVISAYAAKPSRSELKELLAQAYDRFGILADHKHQRAGALSGGQQQMLAIASTLMSKPSFVLLDEPTAGLAPAIVSQVLEVIQNLRADGLGVVLVEQSTEFALACAERIVVLDLGTVVAEVSAKDPRARSFITQAYFAQAGS